MSNRIETLLKNYRKRIDLPWAGNLAGAQRVWFALYPPAEERRLRLRLPDFEMETKSAMHGWKLFDLTEACPQWLSAHAYRDSYFAKSSNFTNAVRKRFEQHVVKQLRDAATTGDVNQDTVFAILGVGSLFGVLTIAEVIKAAAEVVPGRLLVFFPGYKTENNTYKLLDAAIAWNYLAEAIPSDEGVTQ